MADLYHYSLQFDEDGKPPRVYILDGDERPVAEIFEPPVFCPDGENYSESWEIGPKARRFLELLNSQGVEETSIFCLHCPCGKNAGQTERKPVITTPAYDALLRAFNERLRHFTWPALIVAPTDLFEKFSAEMSATGQPETISGVEVRPGAYSEIRFVGSYPRPRWWQFWKWAFWQKLFP